MIAPARMWIEENSRSTVEVYYDLSIEQMLKTGKYQRINDYITDKNFPAETWEHGTVRLEFGLLRFKPGLTVKKEEIGEEIVLRKYRWATARENLAYSQNRQDIRRRFPIFSIGGHYWNHEIMGPCCIFIYGNECKLYPVSVDLLSRPLLVVKKPL